MYLSEQLHQLALSLLPGVGNYLIRQLISHCGSAEAVFQEKRGKLLKIPGVGPQVAKEITGKKVFSDAEKELLLIGKSGAKIIFYTSESYPERLKGIADAPALLYFKGNINLNSKKILSIVGTRNATPYGKKIIEKLIEELTIYPDLIVVSGLAYGIDISAHKASLLQNIPTLGVMASGIDIIYPSLHKETVQKMINNGGIITEYRLGTKPDAPRFPARNRIIAGLCDAIVVVEAAEKGGALITAEIGNSYNKEIFAVPGQIGDIYSEGCHKLIRDHKANIYTNFRDIEYLMGWSQNVIQEKIIIKDYSFLEKEGQQIVEELKNKEGIHLDDLSWKTKLPLTKLATLLLNLEFEGIVKSLPGKKYKLL